jgi:Flp pilus assembly protein CpaB
MKAARLIVLGVALAAGGVAAMLASGSRQPEAPKAPRTTVVEKYRQAPPDAKPANIVTVNMNQSQ